MKPKAKLAGVKPGDFIVVSTGLNTYRREVESVGRKWVTTTTGQRYSIVDGRAPPNTNGTAQTEEEADTEERIESKVYAIGKALNFRGHYGRAAVSETVLDKILDVLQVKP